MSEKDFGGDTESFADIERSFESVVSEILGDRSLDTFRAEYERLHAAFVQSHTNNSALLERCRALNDEITTNSSKIQEALRFSQQDQRTITHLRREVDRAWKSVEALQDRETKSQDIISALKTELTSLAELVQSREAARDSLPSDAELDSLRRDVASSASQVSALRDELNRLSETSGVQNARITKATSIAQEITDETVNEDKKLEDLNTEVSNLLSSVAKLKHDNDISNTALETAIQNTTAARETIERLRNAARVDDSEKTDAQSESIVISRRTRIANDTLKGLRVDSKRTAAEKARIEAELAAREKELAGIRAELATVEKERAENESQLETLKSKRKRIGDEIDCEKKNVTDRRRTILSLTRDTTEKEGNAKAVQRSLDAAQKKREAVTKAIDKERKGAGAEKRRADACQRDARIAMGEIARAGKRANTLEAEISEAVASAASSRTNANQLKADKDDIESRKSEMEKRMTEIAEMTKRRDLQVKELKTAHERGARHMVEMSRETNALRADLKALKTSVKQQKEVITRTDNECMEIHTRLKKTEEKVTKVADQCKTLETQIDNAQKQIQELEIEKLKRVHLLNESDTACGMIKSDMKRVRESMRTQETTVVRRSEEATALRDKILVFENQFRINADRWEQVNGKVEAMQKELVNEVERMGELSEKARQVERLKKECLRLEKELVGNQVRAKCLEDESEIPIGIHRWRFLESTNPELAQLVYMKRSLLDSLAVVLSRTARLAAARTEKKAELDGAKAALKRRKAAVAASESRKEYEKKIQAKTKRLESMVRESLKRKSASNTWIEKINGVREEVVHEKEQFYVTKLKEVPYATVVREPPVLQFSGGQTPRAMIPKLRMTGAASITCAAKSARVCPPATKRSLPPLPTRKRVLPALQPVRSSH